MALEGYTPAIDCIRMSLQLKLGGTMKKLIILCAPLLVSCSIFSNAHRERSPQSVEGHDSFVAFTMTRVQAGKVIKSMKNLSRLNGGIAPSRDEWVTVIKSQDIRVVGYEKDAFLKLYQQGVFGKVKTLENNLDIIAVEAEPSTLQKATLVGSAVSTGAMGAAIVMHLSRDGLLGTRWAKVGLASGVVALGSIFTYASESDRRLWTLILDTDIVKDLLL